MKRQPRREIESIVGMDQAELDSLGADELADAYSRLDREEKAIAKRKSELRERLLAQAGASQERTARGDARLDAGNYEIVAEKRRSKAPDAGALLALVRGRGIDVLDAFNEQKTLEANPSKIEYLVSVGRLRKEELEPLYTETTALRVRRARRAREESQESQQPCCSWAGSEHCECQKSADEPRGKLVAWPGGQP